ncbi:N-acetylmuramoyl-L-alanine amidase [Yimella radicis]
MSSLSRRSFLSVTVVAGAIAAMPKALAVDETSVFADAGREFAVPPALLAAISYGQTRWSDHAGRPSRSLGYGPMHLVDGAAVAQQRAAEGKDDSAAIDTLGAAAAASGISADTLRTDAASNIRAAAALLAARQRANGGAVGASTDPSSWYEAVATTSGLSTPAAQVQYADDVLADLRSGMSVSDGRTRYSVGAQPVGSPGKGRDRVVARAKSGRRPTGPVDAPNGLGVEWVPAPYELYGPTEVDYGNHDLAFRPRSPQLTHVVIHDTECSYEVGIKLVTDATYMAWNYSIRSSDGHIAQHLQTKDIGWHAGNWYMNMHSVGLEHEGFAAQGYNWYSEVMYRRSARLTRHLCRTYGIPMDRAHIIGHDQVPALTTSRIRGMHWDPGPFWDWERYFELMGAPLSKGTVGRAPKTGDVVRILPGFEDNVQVVQGCSGVCVEGTDHGTNFVPLRSAPDASAPLVVDPGLKASPSTTQVSDIGARAAAGTEYAVAEVRGDWTAVWYLGAIAWFHNPVDAPTARVVKGGRTVTPKGATAPVYGSAYPEASAYASPAEAQPISPLIYTMKAGQTYVLSDDSVPTDYYKAKTFSLETPGDHVNTVGRTKYYQVNLGHRVAFVQAADVEIS